MQVFNIHVLCMWEIHTPTQIQAPQLLSFENSKVPFLVCMHQLHLTVVFGCVCESHEHL